MRARLLKLLIVACAALAVAPVTGTAAQSAPGATVDKEGWWNRFTGAANPPESPLRGTAPNPAAPAPEVPEGAIAVGARAGQADRLAALGIVLDAEPGATVNRFVLQVKEAEGQGAQQRSDVAGVVACPITSFFAPDYNGDFANAPEADCEVATAAGERADDGTWTFDLTAIASAWLDPFGTVSANGVRFEPVIENPATTFMVSWTGLEDAVLDVDITPGDDAADPFATGGGGFDAPAGGGSSFDSGSGGGDGFAAPATPVEVPAGDDAAAPTTVPGGSVEPIETTDAQPAVSRAGDTFGNLPGVVPLVAIAGLLVALLAAWTLGTGGASTTTPRRQGGVSRALASRTEA